MVDFTKGKCPECNHYHIYIYNIPCPKCGSEHNKCTQIDGFTNWDDYETYRIECGNERCKHSWTYEQ